MSNNPLSFTDPTGLFDDPYSAYMNQALNDAWNLVTYAAEKTLDVIQTGLDAVGCYPILGEGADAANAGISFARGEKGDAALSLLSMLPIVGDIAAKSLKQVVKHSDVVVDISLKYGDNWSDLQKLAADKKVNELTKADTYVVKKPIRKTNTTSSFRKTNNLDSATDADHIIDLQVGGADTVDNLQGLDKTVNRSLGSQINKQTRDLPDGTKLGEFKIE